MRMCGTGENETGNPCCHFGSGTNTASSAISSLSAATACLTPGGVVKESPGLKDISLPSRIIFP